VEDRTDAINIQDAHKMRAYGYRARLFVSIDFASSGQAIYGSIYGQVTDQTGAVVPNATITVTDESKNTSVQVTSSDQGEYLVEHLIPDLYDIKATATGFQTQENKGIQISADTSPKIDLKLQIGASTQTVEVTSELPQLKTDRADVAKVFDQRTVSDLPIAGRNFASLELLIPGAQVMAWSQNSAEDFQGSPTVNINGQHFSGVSYELDGAANQDPILGQIVINPPLDAVTEAKIATQNYDAEFGQAVAAVVTSQTKSGTNGFHGDAFDYRRSDAQQARNPYTQNTPDLLTGRLLPPALYSQFGGSVGGPILRRIKRSSSGITRVYGKGSAPLPGKRFLPPDPQLLPFRQRLRSQRVHRRRGALPGQIYNPRNINPVTGPAAFPNNLIPNAELSPRRSRC
jgi:hypothetical protein